tara:strand:- start:4812 stop:5876 length:1065 start_codon:yes stop_codon:yes gene_type:complete
MILVNILTKGFDTPNGLSFLLPIIVFKKKLSKKYKIKLFTKITNKLEECDILIIESKYFKDKWNNFHFKIIEQFVAWKRKKIRIIFCDTTDSSSWIKSDVFEFVDKYAKGQLLKNKNLYLKRIYGNRVYADYYYKNKKVKDKNVQFSDPIKPNQLKKLCLSWNSGLSNYSLFSPIIYKYIPVKLSHLIFKFSSYYVSPNLSKDIINCRFGSSYHLESIKYQREQLKKLLTNYVRTDKLNRFLYFKEMRKTLLSIVPFGYGEITLKDFESFMNGCILIKPNLNHMSTWPDFYIKDKTYISFSWDLSDIIEKIAIIKENVEQYIEIAANGQKIYRKHTIGDEAADLFMNQFQKLIS